MRWSKSSPPRCVSPLVDFTLKTPSRDLEDRDVERAAAEVVDRDALGVLLLEAVGERRGGRLVDDALDVEPGDLPGVLRRLALRVVEVRGDGDHRLGHRLAEERLGDLASSCARTSALTSGGDMSRPPTLHPGVAVRRLDDLVGREPRLALRPRARELLPHEPLDRVDGVRGVGHRLALGRLADEALAARREADDRRRRARPLGVRDDADLELVRPRSSRRRRRTSSSCRGRSR